MADSKKPPSCCCSCTPAVTPQTLQAPVASGSPEHGPWIVGALSTPVGNVPLTTARLLPADRFGTWKARWAVGRMDFQVEPGLYAIGKPSSDSHVFVSANYKMSFDRLRSALSGIDSWILVLDTKGVNVWCAAGKGTFGTDELIRQVNATNLSNVVSHRRLIVPQLGAPGIAAHEIRKRSGFRILYGPVRAKDIPAFLDAGMKAAPHMRRVDFPLVDRLAVIPVELVMAAKSVLVIMLALLFLAGLGLDGYSWSRVARIGIGSATLFAAVFVAGTVLTPILLPWLPGRALAVKGTVVGLALMPLVAGCLYWNGIQFMNWGSASAWCLIVPATTSFAAMNFTGATTYTSLSGVRREMRMAVPLQATAAILGALLWLAGRFI